MTRPRLLPTALAISFAVAAACTTFADNPAWTPPEYGTAFNQVWRDGKAELASYQLTYPRYGELREGTATAVTVTEPFNPDKRVKSDRGGEGTHGVIKLNLAEDFQTGVYDYNLMTSVFVATEPANGLPQGAPTKVSFSSQEWCGHVYQQALFSQTKPRQVGVRQTVHSYFETEADQQTQGEHPVGGIAEDALMLWARGLAGPQLEPGQSIDVPLYRSMAIQRLVHLPAAWDQATLSRGDSLVDIEVPAGQFRCETWTAKITQGPQRVYTFFIDTAEDGNRKLIKMQRSDGYAMQLLADERLPYWNLNNNADERELEKIGLQRRGPGEM